MDATRLLHSPVSKDLLPVPSIKPPSSPCISLHHPLFFFFFKLRENRRTINNNEGDPARGWLSTHGVLRSDQVHGSSRGAALDIGPSRYL